jgi:hypothetical protein
MHAIRIADATINKYDAAIFCADAAIFDPDLTKEKCDPSLHVPDNAIKKSGVTTLKRDLPHPIPDPGGQACIAPVL